MKEANLKRIPTNDILEKANYEDSKKISDCQELGERKEGLGRTQRIFRAVKQFYIYYTIIVNICHYTFVQPHRITTPRVNPNFSYGL